MKRGLFVVFLKLETLVIDVFDNHDGVRASFVVLVDKLGNIHTTIDRLAIHGLFLDT